VYLSELDTTAKFIASHVSDGSALHYRCSLLNQIFQIFEQSSSNSDLPDTGQEIAIDFFNDTRENLLELLVKNCCGDCDLCLVQSSMTKDQFRISILFDELRTNKWLSDIFVDHEALWYYRKYLVFSLHKVIERSSCKNECILWSNFKENEKNNVMSHYNRRESYVKILQNYNSWLGRVVGIKFDLKEDKNSIN